MPPRLAPNTVALLVVVVLVAAVVLLRPTSGGVGQASAPRGDQVDARLARQLLDQVSVKGRAAKTGYSRDRFGSGWATVRGCDVRNRILARDLTQVTYRPGTHDCVVATGTLHDPYTGALVAFSRGERTSTLVAVDHRYALALAWQQGAQDWTEERRQQFSNDPRNLQAVGGRTNNAKGASGPGSWLPPNKSYRCRYVIAFVEVAAHWQLSMNPGDHKAAAAVLDHCT